MAGTTAANVAQCGSEPITLAVNPWVGAEANANVAKVLMEEQMGCTVELQDVNEKAQFPGMADGTIDATLEVWPSGHSTTASSTSMMPAPSSTAACSGSPATSAGSSRPT